ncbi:hypothetical protein ACWD4L_37985 [Streptomyces sp. NPDC002596]|uniref:Uncharacterized protein n=1 Tax=Streptomyces yanii TaxID=78510 RepID=A0ABV5RFD5_9ACTN|nr:hypothetical protein [Streptomyces sp. NBC_00841]WSA02796.1 hypothetical protein OHA79_36105 [Streptomyces sp. NBC_00841]
MKKLCESVGFIVFIQGVAGLLHEWTGWFRLWAVVRRLEFLSGYPVFVNIVLVVAGASVMVAADRLQE